MRPMRSAIQIHDAIPLRESVPKDKAMSGALFPDFRVKNSKSWQDSRVNLRETRIGVVVYVRIYVYQGYLLQVYT
jgi:hypothetical protein